MSSMIPSCRLFRHAKLVTDSQRLLKPLSSINIINRKYIAFSKNTKLNSANKRLLTINSTNTKFHGCHVSTSKSQLQQQEDFVVKSLFDDLKIPDVCLGEYLIGEWQCHLDRVALIDALTGRMVKYRDLAERIPRLASGLKKLGLITGDVITLLLPNCVEFIELYIAAASIGVAISAINPLYTKHELKHAIELTESKYIFTIPPCQPVVQETTQEYNINAKIFVVDQNYQSLFEQDVSDFKWSLSEKNNDVILSLPFSSGTTGVPKGVVLTHRNIIANVEQFSTAPFLNTHRTDRIIGVLPFFHVFGQIVTNLGALSRGASIAIIPKFEPEMFLQAIQDYKPTICFVAPPLALFLAKHPLVDHYDLSSLRLIINGAAAVSSEVIHTLLDRLKNPDLVFKIGFGLSETSPVTHLNTTYKNLENNYKSIGVAVHNIQFKIEDVETREPLPANQEGELVVKGPNVLREYLKNEEATREALNNGWFRTGDIGYYNTEGLTFITDRLKELIKVKGFQVAPTELENILVGHPEITDACVIGVPDERAGELPRAYVVLKKGSNLKEEDVQGYVKGKVAVFKELKGGVEFIKVIPKSPTGKILRRVLRDKL